MPAHPNATLAPRIAPPITFKDATETDRNIIQETQNLAATEALKATLWAERGAIIALVKHHLGGLDGECDITIEPPHKWIRGGFNLCIPIEVEALGASRQLILRCALPHKLAERYNPGSVDEKMRCEVGAYAWIQENCPDIRIPRLYGFGFLDQRQFTHEDQRSWLVRIIRKVRRCFHRLLKRPSLLSRYTSHPAAYRFPTAYMLLENVSSDNSRLLSKRLNIHLRNSVWKKNLYQDLSRIILSLSRIPQPRIGSLEFCDNATVTLTNRPLTRTVMNFENEGTPMTAPRDTTYASTDTFIADMFDLHDNRFAYHPTATSDTYDCRAEMATRVLMRSLAHRFIRQDLRHGPFALQLDGIRASNIFVDDHWNITALIDLEWLCALPVETLAVPFWLMDCAVVDIQGKATAEFNSAREEFMGVFEEEERAFTGRDARMARIMHGNWSSNAVWFWHGLMSHNGMSCAFMDHICPGFSTALNVGQENLLSKFWCINSERAVEGKLDQRHEYLMELQGLYGAGSYEGSSAGSSAGSQGGSSVHNV